MKKIITIVALMANAFATSLYAQTAEEIFKSTFDTDEDYAIDDVGRISAYAFYDVDGDGINECFLKGEDDTYCMYCCGDNNGKPNQKALTMSLNNMMTTSLSIVQAKPYINVQGGCGTGCYAISFAKINKSHIEYDLECTSIYGPNEEEEHNCYKRIPGHDVTEIKKAEFDNLVPKNYKVISMENLRWIKRKNLPKSNNNALNDIEAKPTTLHTECGDTIIVKDENGYFYQLMSSDRAGLAPGGAYSGNIEIPAAISYNGSTYLVTTIRKGAMWKKEDTKNIGTITSVTLPKSLTLVGADAFRGNASLENVIYNGKTRIEVRSFWGCPKLKFETRPVKYAYTEPHYTEENEEPNFAKFTKFYYPVDEQDNSVIDYQWVTFKHNHHAMSFDQWTNLTKENAMGCYCYNLNAVRAGVFSINDASNINTMFKGNMKHDQIVLLAHNNYVATHEFVMFSRYNWGEQEKAMPQSFVQAMEKKYGRKVKYSYEAAKALYTKTPEQLVVTEFDITNHEAMVVISWVKDNKEVCSYVKKQKTVPEYEEYSIWNVDDDGNYGIPIVISITKDEKGNMEFFINHSAPESTNLIRLVQKGNKLVDAEGESWYNWVDAPDD